MGTRGLRTAGCQICCVAVILVLINYFVFNSYGSKDKCNCGREKDHFLQKAAQPALGLGTRMLSSWSIPDEPSVSDITKKLGLFSNLTSAASKYGTLLYGHHRNRPGFLTLGIPSVRRPYGRDYLFATIKSIIDNTDDNEKQQIIVVIYFADFNTTWNFEMAGKIYEEFRSYFDDGMIQAIHAPMSVYPDFKLKDKSIPSSKMDSDLRIKWRSKQNLDFAFIMLYSKNLSTYYIQLEDDVVCALNFVSDIEAFVNKMKKFWICLEFTELGFIGKLFRSVHIERLAHTLLTYYDAKPCDLLLGHVFRILGQKEPIHSRPSLFQHIGKWSSLQNKMMPSIDNKFKDFGEKPLPIIEIPNGDNPKATIMTNMDWAPGYGPEHAYNHSSSFFWAKNPLKGSFYSITYRWPMNLRRIIISTGDVRNRKDTLRGGNIKTGADDQCHSNGKNLGSFVQGEFDTDILGTKIPTGIKCISVYLTSSQRGWLILRDIAVFVS